MSENHDYTDGIHPYKLGEAYFMRSVTHHYTGRLKAIYEDVMVFDTCAWIADDGRFADAMASGEFTEVEPYPIDKEIVINKNVILDMHAISFPLPTEQHPKNTDKS